ARTIASFLTPFRAPLDPPRTANQYWLCTRVHRYETSETSVPVTWHGLHLRGSSFHVTSLSSYGPGRGHRGRHPRRPSRRHHPSLPVLPTRRHLRSRHRGV